MKLHRKLDRIPLKLATIHRSIHLAELTSLLPVPQWYLRAREPPHALHYARARWVVTSKDRIASFPNTKYCRRESQVWWMSLGDWVMAGVAIVVAGVMFFVFERTQWKQ